MAAIMIAMMKIEMTKTVIRFSGLRVVLFMTQQLAPAPIGSSRPAIALSLILDTARKALGF